MKQFFYLFLFIVLDGVLYGQMFDIELKIKSKCIAKITIFAPMKHKMPHQEIETLRRIRRNVNYLQTHILPNFAKH